MITKILTGIPGFDSISNGGLPKGRTTLVCGTAGSSKTVFAVQFLVGGLRSDTREKGVFVTFEESPADIKQNMAGFGWDIAAWEASDQWAFVDASPQPEEESIISGSFDFGALLSRIEYAVSKVDATRVSIDSMSAIFQRFDDTKLIRRELHRITTALKKIGVTAIITSERNHEYGDIARLGIEEFVSDNVIVLRNVLDAESRRRTMEILKFRGTDHQKGEHPFTIVSDGGIVGVPLSTVALDHKSSKIRATSGSESLDQMCDGGFFRDSIVLISGATGTGKTLMATSFIGGAADDERSLFLAFEESHDQLCRNAEGWGVDFEQMQKDGKLKILALYPESIGLEEHLIRIKDVVEKFKPTRIALDSLSALERGSNTKGFREFVIGLTSFIKHKEIVAVFTSVTPSLMGGQSITEAHISTITDTIILLRYVELFGEISRGIAVLKMRGSSHDKDIRQFAIGSDGMHIEEPFKNITGILTGNPQYHEKPEADRLREMFSDE